MSERWCAELLARVSRTFALSIEALPASLRPAVRTAYLLCRVVDTIEDSEGLRPPTRQQLFDAFDLQLADDSADARALERAFAAADPVAPEAEQQLCRGAARVFAAFRALPPAQRDAIRPRVQQMSAGMREYAARADAAGLLQLEDTEDLERYCYFVAGTVGELLTALFGQQVPLPRGTRAAIDRRAVSFGIGLQLVNIVKDAADDHARQARFVPRQLATQHGLRLDRLLHPGQREAGLRALRAICALARQHLDRAAEYTALWPLPAGEPVRLFCVVPLALALATLQLVERGTDALRPGREPKVSRQTVAEVLSEARRAARDDDSLRRMLARHGWCAKPWQAAPVPPSLTPEC